MVLTERAARSQTSLELKLPFREDAAAWYVARATDRSGRRAWTNPVYFVHRDRPAARPLKTRLSATVFDEATGKAVAGTVRVYAPDGSVLESRAFEKGQFALVVPPSAGIEVSSPGYVSRSAWSLSMSLLYW